MTVFLDVDGVLNSLEFFKGITYRISKYLKRKHPNDYGLVNNLSPYNLFWVGLFCRIVHPTIVLSSSYRYEFKTPDLLTDKDIANNFLWELDKHKIYLSYRTSLTGEISKKDNALIESLGKKCNFLDTKYTRGFQIAKYIKDNNIGDDFIIFEDDVQDIDCYDSLKDHIVQTSFYGRNGGFRFTHLLKSLKLAKKLNRGDIKK